VTWTRKLYILVYSSKGVLRLHGRALEQLPAEPNETMFCFPEDVDLPDLSVLSALPLLSQLIVTSDLPASWSLYFEIRFPSLQQGENMQAVEDPIIA
jgi:hypothetical protein